MLITVWRFFQWRSSELLRQLDAMQLLTCSLQVIIDTFISSAECTFSLDSLSVKLTLGQPNGSSKAESSCFFLTV